MHLHNRIVTTQENTVGEWLTVLFEMLFELPITAESLSAVDSGTVLDSTLAFCSEMATIENRLLHSLHPELQLYALVAAVHRFRQQLHGCP